MRNAAVILGVLCLGVCCYGRTITVALEGSGEFSTIQAAIDAAVDGDEVVVADGTYTGDGNRDIDLKGKAITVRSANGPEHCIIDCQNVAGHRGFYLPDGQGCAAVISGFTIRGGLIEAYDARGGGIYCRGYSLLLENCVIMGNAVKSRYHEFTGGFGGGLYCASSSVALHSCVISGNGAYGKTQWIYGTEASGGGVYCDASSTLDMVDCVVRDNAARGGDGAWDGSSSCGEGGDAFGGGLYFSSDSTGTLCRSIVSSNVARGGEGSWGDGGGPIGECSAPGGAGHGGGVYGNAAVSLRSCVLMGNSTPYWKEGKGGGAFACGDIVNCTIVNNSARTSGGGLFGDSVVKNSVVYGNSAPAGANVSGAPTVTYSNVGGGHAGQGNIDADPGFVDAYHISADSPCTNGGDPDAAFGDGEKDIDGQPRVSQGRVDMGADEVFCTDVSGTLKVPQEFSNIQAAIDAAADGDVVLLAPGLYAMEYQQTVDFKGKAITVRGEGGPAECIVEPGPSYWNGFVVHEADGAQVEGLTIRGCIRGIDVVDSEMSIRNCVITGGCGIRMLGSEVDVNDCVIADCSLGIEIGESTACIERCVIANCTNEGPDAGVSCGRSSLEMRDCVIRNNIAMGVWMAIQGFGAGLSAGGSTITMEGCIVAQNEAWGISSYDAEYGEWWWQPAEGGGIRFTSGTFSMTNCVVSENSAKGYASQGGKPSKGGGIWGSGTISLTNCIVRDNSGDEGSEMYVSGDVRVGFCNVGGGWDGEGNIDAEPFFADAAGGDYHLKSAAGRWDAVASEWVYDPNTSPCIDAGDPASDWRGELWPHGGRINMGAYGGTREASMSLNPVGDAADLDYDDVVGLGDFGVMAREWGVGAAGGSGGFSVGQATPCIGDLDRDGVVGLGDLAVFAGEWMAD